MKRLIVNADDFGMSTGVNRGVIEAKDRGILTSASLMIEQAGTREAVQLASERPELSVGLHVVVTHEDGRPTVDLDDQDAVRAALDGQMSRFEDLFAARPTHLDAHHNVHRDPRLESAFVAFTAEYGVPLREHSTVRYFPDFYGQWDGVTHPEQISPSRLIRMLEEEVGFGFTELSCHPARVDGSFASAYSTERAIELATLCAPEVREAVFALGIQLASYHDVP